MFKPALISILCIFLLIFLTTPSDCKKGKKCQNDDEGGGCKKKKSGKKYTKASFDEWRDWEKTFPNCDPKKNPNLSPVNIVKKDLIQLKDESPLNIYSGPPLKGVHYYSAEYVYDGVMMQAVTLHPRKGGNFRDLTYINGAGNKEYRYFQNALFLFKKNETEVEGERSLHQIEGKKFLLEVVLTFTDISIAGREPSDITQVHVMVERSETLFPAWDFLKEGSVGLMNINDVGIDSTKVILEAQDDFRQANESLKKALDQATKGLSKEEKDMNFEDLLADLQYVHKMVGFAEDDQDLLATDTDLKTKIEDTQKSIEDLRKSKGELEKTLDSLKEDLTRQISAGMMRRGDKNEKTDELSKLQMNFTLIDHKLTDTYIALQNYQKKHYQVSQDLGKQKRLLTRFKIGDAPNAQFKSVKALKEKLEIMEIKRERISEAKSKLISAQDKLETIRSQSARDVLLAESPFQISWLLPSSGGYYRYQGSSVVPPCSNRSRVLVLENPITMSDEQFSLITAAKGRYQKEIDDEIPPQPMDKRIPILRDLGKRKVYYNKKNLQFKLDDAVHIQSKLRHAIKEGLPKAGVEGNITKKGKSLHFFLVVTTLLFIRVL